MAAKKSKVDSVKVTESNIKSLDIKLSGNQSISIRSGFGIQRNNGYNPIILKENEAIIEMNGVLSVLKISQLKLMAQAILDNF